MEVIALSLADANFNTQKEYLNYLKATLGEKNHRQWDLVVFPAFSALLFALKCGLTGNYRNFADVLHGYLEKWEMINQSYLELHAQLCRECCCFIIAGTMPEVKGEKLYHSTAILDREGNIAGIQRQTHLSREEKDLGFSRGKELSIFHSEEHKIGIIIGTDAWYPEVSRILALMGADIICHPGAIPEPYNFWRQIAGMWQEVQQNQFFCIESQLCASIAGRAFSARCIIHAPCEMTEGKTGFLALGQRGEKSIHAFLDFPTRKEVITHYPLQDFLNPTAYRRYFPSIYHREKRRGV